MPACRCAELILKRLFEYLSKTLDKDQLRHFLEKVHADENFVNNIGERITKKGGSKEARQLRLEQAVNCSC